MKKQTEKIETPPQADDVKPSKTVQNMEVIKTGEVVETAEAVETAELASEAIVTAGGDEEPVVIPPPPPPPPPPIRKMMAAFAAVLLFFGVIGMMTSVRVVVGKVDDIRSQRALKEEFAQYIHAVVINDPPPFDEENSLPPALVINCAIWNIILTRNKDHYESEYGVIYIPKFDVEQSAHSLFGFVPQEHVSVRSRGMEFIFSDENNSYEIPANPILFSNSPLVTNISKAGEVYTVTVDYIPPSPMRIAGVEHEVVPIKTMEYVITRSRSRDRRNTITKTITAIQIAGTEQPKDH